MFLKQTIAKKIKCTVYMYVGCGDCTKQSCVVGTRENKNKINVSAEVTLINCKACYGCSI